MTEQSFFAGLETPTTPTRTAAPRPEERRGLFNRPLRERRASLGRVNVEAPRQSQMKIAAGWAVSASLTVFFLLMIAGELLYDRQLALPMAVAGAVVALSALALMLGCIEQRLIEIRLELMMQNGGARRSDRDRRDRREDDRPASAVDGRG